MSHYLSSIHSFYHLSLLFSSVPFSAACGFGIAFGLHIGSGGGGGVVCGLPLRLEEQLVEKGYPSNQTPNENT
jgi:hypothetical protein